MVEGKVTEKIGKLGGVAGQVLICPPPLPERTPREHDTKSFRPKGK